ncbi:hypothetical protein V8C44DRAFT_153158 [Trichoderma aethiopicum]
MPTTYPSFHYSQEGEETELPLTYTGSPWQLFASDVRLFFVNILYIPFIFLPLYPWPSGPLDELYPTWANIIDIALHCVLFVLQLSFLISLPLLVLYPVSIWLLYVAAFLMINAVICLHFNRGIPPDGLKSTADAYSEQWESHDDEAWIFLNGICVGKHWLQNNVDRLSCNFHRPVVGVHNKTYGVVFDLVQCLIQRALLYATSDIRDCYVKVKKALYQPGVKKVVLILHSQGGIEGGMILDWLLDEVPQDLLQILEVYTFGCLANHFSNPSRSITSPESAAKQSSAGEAIDQRAIPHIEHYANAYDFASRWGVLAFTKKKVQGHLESRFMGKVFVNPRAGHQLNQHYLDSIFPLDPTGRFTREPVEGDFMDMKSCAETDGCTPDMIHGGRDTKDAVLGGQGIDGLSNSLRNNDEEDFGKVEKMCHVSRLWQYRNGGCPRS